MARRNKNYNDVDFGGDFGGSYGDSGERRGLFWFNSWDELLSFSSRACLWWLIGVPMGVALIWGVYKEDNLFGVIGIGARRGGGAFIQETSPVGESLLNGTTKGRFVPGKVGADDTQKLGGGR